MLSRNSLSVGYIHSGSNKDDFFRSLWNFRLYDFEKRQLWIDTDLIGATSLYLDNNRNEVVDKFRTRRNKEALLFIDSDMGFEPEVVYTLVDALDQTTCPIVSGFYGAWRKGTLYPEWWEYDDKLGFIPLRVYKGADSLIQKIDGCGMGFCLIHRSVFDKFPNLGDDPWRWYGRDLGLFEGNIRRLDEDICFSARARNLGIPIYGHCHTGLMIRHQKESPVSLQTWIDQMRIANL